MHPRATFAHELRTLHGSAAELGYRMPAEWTRLDAVWLSHPHNPTTWPGCLAEAQAQHANFAREASTLRDRADRRRGPAAHHR